MNLSKASLVIRREYLTRVRKKSFIVMTVLGPLLMGGVIIVPYFASTVSDEKRTIAVLDDSHLFEGKFKGDQTVNFIYLEGNLDSLRKENSGKGKISDILYIPASEDITSLTRGIILYSNTQASVHIIDKIENTIENEISSAKYAAAQIDEKVLESIRKTDVEINTRDMQNKKTSSGLTTGIGLASGILIYMFIFIYGALVMRGVMEEKTNRIVEVIISSVKPFELMLGKIIGVALVGLTQFLLWIILTFGIYSMVSSVLFKDQMNDQAMQQMIGSRVGTGIPGETLDSISSHKNNWAAELTEAIDTINFPLIATMFLFYFLGGYLLYSALFAAIGAAVDSETDTQQFMLPITIPLIVSVVMVQYVILNPEGTVAFWLSMIPFTSPIIMMVRIPFGVDVWQVLLSMALLVLGFIGTTWLAAKIYRTGILLYGKKVSYRELMRWLFYKG
jgi:ABC-2 type transport system permease protein